VAFGNWEQEDITRYADDYQRAGAPAGPGQEFPQAGAE